MIDRSRISEIIESYDAGFLSVSCIGSHSALEVFDGAKDEGFSTIAVCQKDRMRAYVHFKRIVDRMIVIDKFSEVLREDVMKELRASNSIFVPNRSFTTYVPYEGIENEFLVPIFGNRALLKAEERWAERNQYYLLSKAGIRMPMRFGSPDEIDRPVIVKVQEAKRKAERAFFIASSPSEYRQKARERIEAGLISEDGLSEAVIEEFVIGTLFNFNYFYSPIDGRLEFLGADRRLQTNLYDFVNLPAKEQLEVNVLLQNIEVGHQPASIRESLLEKVLEVGEKFVETVREEYPPGIIGPFALQGAINKDLEFVVFDVSLRVPGSPMLTTTSPYSKYYYGFIVGVGRRIAMEIKRAAEQDRLKEVVT
ncbi:MAG: formate--phosphoribosylaminoimidazolecarboxamide ligase family protein [Nitrososphaerota archaeon]|nr:formate--phosphoribosylaminoimidazolecarboxamide ligase family protein [Aigarchaeota archaeon]MDW8076667.1 formate--phosphoribosylaminoimidazolecarboxamide ligase family protein [Nitrososphaerota archaeon]